MLTTAFHQFFRELEANNHREWFENNKKRFEKDVKIPFTDLVAQLVVSFHQVDAEIQGDPRDMLFRIHKDTRFSKDKTPYKTHMAAVISKHGRKDHTYPGFYLHAEAGNLTFGGGAYFLEKEPLERVRLKITREPDRFQKIIVGPEFVRYYGHVLGEKNKKLAPEFAAFLDRIPEIANKQFYYLSEMPAETLLKPDLVPHLTAMARAALPFNHFLKEALTV